MKTMKFQNLIHKVIHFLRHRNNSKTKIFIFIVYL